MQYQLNKEQFDALSDDLKKEYKLDGDTATLVIEGEGAPNAETIATLEKKRGIEIDHRKNAEAKLQEAENRAAELQSKLDGAKGDPAEIEKIRKEHAKEIEILREERAAEVKKAAQERNQAMINKEASKFAAEKFTVPSLISDQVAKRLTVEEVDGTPVVRVLTPEGKPSTASIGDLQKEFLDNPEFSGIIKAKVGNGGGAPPNHGGGAPVTKKLSEMSVKERAALERNDPQAYAAAKEAMNG